VTKLFDYFDSEVFMKNFLSLFIHIIGFGIVFTALMGGWIIERRLKAEKEWNRKLFLGTISRRFSILFPVGCIITLLSGIMNIFNMYNGSINLLYMDGWLIAKIILFAFLFINGAFFGPVLARRRTKIIQGISDKNAPEDTELTLKVINKSTSTYYLVQFILLIIILFLSIAGSQERPGII